MAMYASSPDRFHQLCWLALLFLLAPIAAHAGNASLQARYAELKPALQKNVYAMPISIFSSDGDHRMLGEVYGVIDSPFQSVHTALTTPAHWCEIVPLHLNIKACTYQHQNAFCQLTFYTGRKYYEKPDDVYQLAYRFSLSEDLHDYFHVDLSSAHGPMGTSDYNIQVEAIPLTDTTSFIHFRYAYSYNYLTQLGMNTYLATLGQDKVGFSVISKNGQDAPVLVSGIRGIIERNAVRYYLAIKSYMDTVQVAPDRRFDARSERWFELTERHHRQLYEMDKEEYLTYKHQELTDQQRLQKAIHRKGHDLAVCNSMLAKHD